MAELIVALDVDSRKEAVKKVNAIGDSVGFYKIGLELFTAEGPDVVKAVKDLGKKIFLDLKLHDIPRTVERAVKSGGKLGVDLMTIHSIGGKAMISDPKGVVNSFMFGDGSSTVHGVAEVVEVRAAANKLLRPTGKR